MELAAVRVENAEQAMVIVRYLLPHSSSEQLVEPVRPALSLTHRPGETGIRTLKVALLVADGVDAGPLQAACDALGRKGAVARLVGPRLGSFRCTDGSEVEAHTTLAAEPGFLFDAVVLPAGPEAVEALLKQRAAQEFVMNVHLHCKPILLMGADAQKLLVKAGGSTADPGVVQDDMDAFEAALKHRRFWEREQ